MAEVAVFQDQQSSGVAGTTITTTIADQPLNTVVFNNITGASLSANQVTLPAGDYVITVVDTQYAVGSSSSYMFITDASNNILDSGELTVVNGGGRQMSAWSATISLSVSTAIKYRAIGVLATFTRVAHSQGNECYQKLIIQKL